MPCMHLFTVCWMDNWALIENIKLPEKDDITLNLFFYHMLGPNFYCENSINVRIAEQLEKKMGLKDFKD